MIPQGYPLWVRIEGHPGVHLVVGWDDVDDDQAPVPVLAHVPGTPTEGTTVEWRTERDMPGRLPVGELEAVLLEYVKGPIAPSTVDLVRHLRKLIATWS